MLDKKKTLYKITKNRKFNINVMEPFDNLSINFLDDFSRELIIYNITIENIHNTLRAVDLNILKNDVENYFNDNFGINFKFCLEGY